MAEKITSEALGPSPISGGLMASVVPDVLADGQAHADARVSDSGAAAKVLSACRDFLSEQSQELGQDKYAVAARSAIHFASGQLERTIAGLSSISL